MADGYSFRPIGASDEELERTSRLLRRVFTGATHLTPRYLHWQYAENPDGSAVGCNAYLGGELVGTMAAVPMAGRLDGEARPGLFMLNGAVHADHRGRKLQSRISAAIFEEAASRGFAFCFGTGNKYSTGPLLTRFRMVKPLEARIGVGIPRRRRAGGAPSFERAWSEAAMRWRLANPERAYRVGAINGGSLVTAPSGVPGLDAVLYDGPESWPSDGARPAAARLRLWIGLDPENCWDRSRHIAIPKRLRASPLNLVFKDLTGGSYLPDPERVTFRAADFDPY
jgi:hypothetical protein